MAVEGAYEEFVKIQNELAANHSPPFIDPDLYPVDVEVFDVIPKSKFKDISIENVNSN